MPGQVIMGKDPNGKFRDIGCDLDGNLKCELTSSIDVAIGEVEMIGTANVDGSGGKRNAVVNSVGAMSVTQDQAMGQPNNIGDGSNMLRTMQYGYDQSAGQQRPLKVDGDGHLQIDVLSGGGGDATAANQTTGNASLATIAGDTTSLDTKITSGNQGNISTGHQVLPYAYAQSSSNFVPIEVNSVGHMETHIHGNTAADGSGTAKSLLVDTAGHLQVDIASGGGGDASAANQSTMITHLSEIEGAVETLEACVTSDKVNVRFEAGDLNIGNVDVVSSVLPTGAATSALQGGGLPAALDSGSLKVAIQSGNISGFATSTLQGGGLPAALTGSGNLKVAVEEGAITGFATSANQSTANGHLSEIEGAVETLEACVTSDKVNVRFEAGDLNIGNVDVASSVLPTGAATSALQGGGLPAALDSGSLKVAIQSGNISGFSTSTLQGGGLPAALTGSGNLKVAVEEGAISGFSTSTLQGGGLPAALTGSGNLKVSVEEGAISGFATSANQSTAIGHLSEIEGAVETLEACVTSDKVNVRFEAGDLNIGNVDVASSVLPTGASTESSLTAMSAKLPASLGQKANASSLSICRSSTAGAFDLSARTTIGTASTTTKLLCDSAGQLRTKHHSNTNNTTHQSGTSISASGGTVNFGLNTDSSYCVIHLQVDTSDSGFLTDLFVRQSADNSKFFLTHKFPLNDWVIGNPSGTVYFQKVKLETPTDYVQIINFEAQANKVQILVNTGRD